MGVIQKMTQPSHSKIEFGIARGNHLFLIAPNYYMEHRRQQVPFTVLNINMIIVASQLICFGAFQLSSSAKYSHCLLPVTLMPKDLIIAGIDKSHCGNRLRSEQKSRRITRKNTLGYINNQSQFCGLHPIATLIASVNIFHSSSFITMALPDVV